jgi:hypothetical protein
MSTMTSARYNKYTALSSARTQPFNNQEDATVNWSNLGERIEDWFVEAKSPEQKVVYRFLKNLKSEDRTDGKNSVISNSSDQSDKASNLEDVLTNLKKFE